MRSAGNFHPEWGYLAPAPTFMRSVRVALVAIAIGATAGAVVVVSLVNRPGANDDNSSIAAHALVTTNAPVVTAPTVAVLPFGKTAATALAQASIPTKLQPPEQPSAATITAKPAPGPTVAVSANEADTAPASRSSPPPASMPALAESAPAQDPAPAVMPDPDTAKSGTTRKHRVESKRRWQAAGSGKRRWHNNHGLASLFHIFSSPFTN